MNQNINTTIEINASNIISEISPLIYGNFVEFITDCINEGMWAELLPNRGFENTDTNGDGVSDPWFPVGINDAYQYQMDEMDAFNSKYSQKVEVINHYGGYRGIAQDNLRVCKGEKYRGYVWMRANNLELAVDINIKSRNNSFYFTKRLYKLQNQWEKFEFCFECPEDDDSAIFEIAVIGEGILWIDQTSLMPESAVDGIWKDVVAATASLKPGIIRFPGGCFADCYHWEDGIGPKDLRPTKENQHWKGNEENNFGTDEFIAFCRNTDSEPMICVNFGSGTPEDAANWVEYCNGSIETKYGALRAQNGSIEPFNVKYWDIGNETFADWEIGHCSAADFSRRYMKFYKAMKAKDDSIEILACGGNGNDLSQEWNKTLLEVTGGRLQHITLHCYAPQIGNISMENDKLYYGTVGAVSKYQKVVNETRKTLKEFAPDKDIKIAITEWNTMFNNFSYREHTLEAAIFNAGMLNMFLKNSDIVHVCNYSDLVNGWQGGCIRSRKGKVHFTPSYYAIMLYSKSGAKHVIETNVECEQYDIEEVGHIKDIRNVPFVDSVACLGDNELIIFIINRHLEESAFVNFNIKGVKTKEYALISEISSTNPYDVNTAEREFVRIKESMLYDNGLSKGFLVSPYSIVRLRLPIV